MRHAQIAQDHVWLPLVEELQPGITILSLDNVIADFAEIQRDAVAHRVIIVDDQNSAEIMLLCGGLGHIIELTHKH